MIEICWTFTLPADTTEAEAYQVFEDFYQRAAALPWKSFADEQTIHRWSRHPVLKGSTIHNCDGLNDSPPRMVGANLYLGDVPEGKSAPRGPFEPYLRYAGRDLADEADRDAWGTIFAECAFVFHAGVGGANSGPADWGIARWPMERLFALLQEEHEIERLRLALPNGGEGWAAESHHSTTPDVGCEGMLDAVRRHALVVAALDCAKRCGFGVEVLDSGELWQTRDPQRLFSLHNEDLIAALRSEQRKKAENPEQRYFPILRRKDSEQLLMGEHYEWPNELPAELTELLAIIELGAEDAK